jgi:hypothetical protein
MVEPMLAKSARLHIFPVHGGWIAYHSLHMRPMAVSGDVVRLLERFQNPARLPEPMRAGGKLENLAAEIAGRGFLVPPGTDEFTAWLERLLPDGHLRPPAKAIWSAPQNIMAEGPAILRALAPLVDQSPAPFVLVMRENGAPFDWESCAAFLDEEADRNPQIDWIVFIVIASGAGLNARAIRRMLPVNAGFRIDALNGDLAPALDAVRTLVAGRAKAVLRAPLGSLENGSLRAAASAGARCVAPDLPDCGAGSTAVLLARIKALRAEAAEAGVLVNSFWDGPAENFKAGNPPERMSARLEIDSHGRVRLAGSDLGAVAEVTPASIDSALRRSRFELETHRCQDCPILGVCPGPQTMRPHTAGGARCDLAIACFEDHLEALCLGQVDKA